MPYHGAKYEQDTTYRSQGVHKNRDATAKMEVDAIDRDGVSDSQKQDQRDAAAAATSKNMEDNRTKIAVDERIGSKPQKDLGTEVRASGFKAEAKAGARVEPGMYQMVAGPGSGRDSGWGKEGTQSNPASDTSMKDDPMGGMMGGMGGGGGSMGGGGGEGGGEGGGMMSGLPAQIGKDLASKDDEIDRANNELFYDDTDIEGHQRLGERLQGR